MLHRVWRMGQKNKVIIDVGANIADLAPIIIFACPSFILSNGYVNAIIGAIIVKNAINTTLFKYCIVNVIVSITIAKYITV